MGQDNKTVGFQIRNLKTDREKMTGIEEDAHHFLGVFGEPVAVGFDEVVYH